MFGPRKGLSVLGLFLLLGILLLAFLPRGVPSSGASTWGSFPPPAYDSGWVPIAKGQTITLWHMLNVSPDKMLVFIYAWDTSAGDGYAQIGINNNGLGLNDGGLGFDFLNLTSTSIQICRGKDSAHADLVRVKIWVHP